MKCEDCKYKNNVENTNQTGSAICSYPGSWFPVHLGDNCHFVPEKKELTCGDCASFGVDFACAGCFEDDSAYYNDKLCEGFIDKQEEEFDKILMYWKVRGLYDRKRINKLIDQFEEEYRKLTEQ